MRAVCFFLSLAGALQAQEGDTPEPPLFEESELEGFRTTSGSTDKNWIIEVNGPGIVVGDFDGEGNHDLVVIDGSTPERVQAGEPGLPPRLFVGDGQGALVAADDAWRIAGGRWGTGGTAADVEGDGDLDLVVVEWGPDRLLRNDAGRGFVEEDTPAFAGSRWGTSAAFLDHDRDGDLDLAVVNYLAFDFEEIPSRESNSCRWKGHPVMCGPEGLTAVHDQLYENDGTGAFRDVSVQAGFRPDRAAFGLGALALDVDQDGDTDLYITNDSTPNHLWQNGGADGLSEIGLRYGVALDANGKEQAGMGIAAGDLNGDGQPELFVTNFSGESNALYVSGRRGRWRERAAPFGLGGPSQGLLGWGTAVEDFDLDGDLDIAVVNGHVYPQAQAVGTDTSYAQPDLLHLNLGGGKFSAGPLSARAPSVSRTATTCDLDGDGALDLIVADLDGAVRVLHNTALRGKPRHWLRVRLQGRAPNLQGLGARIEVVQGEESAWREIGTSAGFQAAKPAEAHFGLGDAERLEKLIVHWPSGARSVLADVGLDHVLVVSEPEAPEPEETDE